MRAENLSESGVRTCHGSPIVCLLGETTRVSGRNTQVLQPDLQLCQQRLQPQQEFARSVMRRRLLVESLLHLTEKLVEFLRLDHRPRNDLQFARMKTSDEIRVLFVLNDLLELERKSGLSLVTGRRRLV